MELAAHLRGDLGEHALGQRLKKTWASQGFSSKGVAYIAVCAGYLPGDGTANSTPLSSLTARVALRSSSAIGIFFRS